jgi:nucleoside 2-deoxyribosyltransferase
MVFEPAPERTFALMKQMCAHYGLQGVSPLDNQVGLEGVAAGHTLAERIVRADIALMQRLDAGLFCLDGVRRGPEMDAGTAFEVGYMAALGKPLMGWTRDAREYPQKVQEYFQQPMQPALANSAGAMSGGLRDPDGMLLHSQGCVQNAMVQIAIELSGGTVHSYINWEIAFDQAASALATRLDL